MISEHTFSRLDEVFLRLDEIVEVCLLGEPDEPQDPGYSLDWQPDNAVETVETKTAAA